MGQIKIVDYEPAHQPYFDRLNRDWIEEYFVIEAFDEYVLSNPEEAILNKGGSILMALYDGAVAGTVGLRKLDRNTFELPKWQLIKISEEKELEKL